MSEGPSPQTVRKTFASVHRLSPLRITFAQVRAVCHLQPLVLTGAGAVLDQRPVAGVRGSPRLHEVLEGIGRGFSATPPGSTLPPRERPCAHRTTQLAKEVLTWDLGPC
jgi:hypothetical protein